jgi:hypothetical protein
VKITSLPAFSYLKILEEKSFGGLIQQINHVAEVLVRICVTNQQRQLRGANMGIIQANDLQRAVAIFALF